MANLLAFTEQFDNATEWTNNNCTITANSGGSAPAIYGASATAPDTLADNSAAALGQVQGTLKDILNDSADYIFSLFIKKDATTSRFPTIASQIAVGGTPAFSGVSVNTSAGTLAAADGVTAPSASGVVDVDASWWRVWFRTPNNNTGNVAIRINIYPAASSTLGGTSDVGVTGSIVAWGANITQSSSLQAYEPDPFYVFETPSAIIFKNRLG